jgi:hypothetical protein
MSKGQKSVITQEKLHEAFQARADAERTYFALLAGYHIEKLKEGSKKRDLPTEPEEKDDQKKPKIKGPGWVCHGNVEAKTACPLSVEDQVPDTGTRFEKKTYDTCTVCKKDIAKTKKEEKKNKKKNEGK